MKDSLTNLASAPLLFEELRREIARATRRQESISLIRLLPEIETVSELHSANLLGYPNGREILLFSQSLDHITREEDICARMGEIEFLTSMNTSKFDIDAFISRLVVDWKSELERDRSRSRATERAIKSKIESALPSIYLQYSVVQLNPGESALDILNRLDMLPLRRTQVS